MFKNAPVCAEASAGTQMQIELCEILHGSARNFEEEAYQLYAATKKMRATPQMAGFQHPVRSSGICSSPVIFYLSPRRGE
jgi:hypothetical protein